MLVTAPSFSVVEKADIRKHHTFERLMIFTATVPVIIVCITV